MYQNIVDTLEFLHNLNVLSVNGIGYNVNVGRPSAGEG